MVAFSWLMIKPDLTVITFDGSIEIRPWDKTEVQVVVEKRGRDKEDIDRSR